MPADPAARRAEQIRAELHGRAADRMAGHLHQQADNLRRLAAKLDDLADQVPGLPNPPDNYKPASSAEQIASRALHEVMWDLANMNLDRLPDDAWQLNQTRQPQ